MYNPCGSSCVKTCQPDVPCYSRQCVPKCECPENSPIWYGDYTCIQKSQCPASEIEKTATEAPEVIPECSGGQMYNSCGSACTKTCDDPMPRCSKQCVPKCECPANSPIWYGDYTCVAKEQCPRTVDVVTKAPEVIPECSGGQIYNSCGSACTKTCDDPMPRCSKQCVPKCECPANSPIWYGDYTCVAKEQCPRTVDVVTKAPEVIPECSGGQIYNSCGSACTKTCGNQMPRCSKQCVPKCECPSNSPIWYGDYTCIAKEQCPAVDPVDVPVSTEAPGTYIRGRSPTKIHISFNPQNKTDF